MEPAKRVVIDPDVQRIVALFERLSLQDLPHLADIYSADARFKDPFNDVQGVAAIQGIFKHMFTSLDGPRFTIRDTIVEGDQCFLSWDFRFRMKRFNREEQVIRGSTHLKLSAEGRITLHRDYWDAAEELYEKLPLLGVVMRWLKRRANG